MEDMMDALTEQMARALELAYAKLSFWSDDDRWDDRDERALKEIWEALAAFYDQH